MAVIETRKPAAESFRDYELVIIANAELAPEKFDTVLEDISRRITEKGGSVAETQHWGKRKLAFPIRHYLEGHYALLKFKSTPAVSRRLSSDLRISEQVIRHMLINLDT